MERQEMEGKQRRKALLVTHVSGFVPQFEMNNVHILQKMGRIFLASSFLNSESMTSKIAS